MEAARRRESGYVIVHPINAEPGDTELIMTAFLQIDNHPVIFVHGNSDSALFHADSATGWTKSVEAFKVCRTVMSTNAIVTKMMMLIRVLMM